MLTETVEEATAPSAPRHGVDNVFLALIPDDQAGSQTIDIQKQNLPGLGRSPYLVPKDCLHVSLLDLGTRKNLIARDISVTIRQAREALDRLQFESFDVLFDQTLSFGNQAGLKPFVLQMGQGREQVALLCKKLKLVLASAGIHSEDKATTPHMTLARAAQTLPAAEIKSMSWRAAHVVLVHSVVGETRHIHLQSWPLRRA
ncbi:MAG: 2'-5' RNA ligase family protein [Pseudomonadota bacterium]